MKKILNFSLFFFLLGSNIVIAQSFTEILGRPTDNSITVSVLFDQATDLYIEYGAVSGVYTSSTTQITNVAGTPDEIDLTGLNADTKYYYRTRYRASGGGTFLAGTEHSFYTQRAVGSTFSFDVEADVHLCDKKGARGLYRITLANEAADNPDFMLDLGDNFGNDHNPLSITSHQLDSLHKMYRPFYGIVCPSAPLYLCLGNHEGEKDYYLNTTPPNNMAVNGTLWRKFYYPNPYPNNFYTGDTAHEGYGIGQPENYYAWTWGNALFVVLDVYRYDCYIADTTAKPENWNWTLGFEQYTWLKNTLENSTAQYKFVFAHHTRGEGRGGIETAKCFEWGGYESDSTTWGFTTNRPGWAKPIHQLFVDNGVNIFFQGHDHLFAHEVLDGVTYQEVPMAADSTYRIGITANGAAYVSDTLDGSGHIRVNVSPACVKVDYVRAYKPADTLSGIHHNREIAFTYNIGNCTTGIENVTNEESVKVYPNPASNTLFIKTENSKDYSRPIALINMMGETITAGEMKSGNTSEAIDISAVSSGLYFVKVFDHSNYSISKIAVIK